MIHSFLLIGQSNVSVGMQYQELLDWILENE